MIEFRIYSGLITVGETDQPDSDGLEPHRFKCEKIYTENIKHAYGKANPGHNTRHLHGHVSNFLTHVSIKRIVHLKIKTHHLLNIILLQTCRIFFPYNEFKWVWWL